MPVFTAAGGPARIAVWLCGQTAILPVTQLAGTEQTAPRSAPDTRAAYLAIAPLV